MFGSIRRGRAAMLGLLFAAGLLSACAHHNHPQIDTPTKLSETPRARVYADINGNFFPDRWRETIGERAVTKNRSLLAAIGSDPDKRQELIDFETRFLNELSALSGRGKGRAYVFMVGFNADQASSAVQLAGMQDVVAATADDLIVEFYWDGQHAHAGVDAAPIWFSASGNSQLVGQRGLRRVLDALKDREVFVVSYSRGASVVLSALSDPEYDDGFVEETLRLPYLRGAPLDPLFQPEALQPGKPIHVAMMAPAIGRPDFWAFAPDSAPRTLRKFPQRLASLRYTVNPKDEILNKAWVIGPRRFNSTELGAREGLGAALACDYPWLHSYPVESAFGHQGLDYLRDASYRRMLRDAGAPLVRPLDGPAVSALTCQALPSTRASGL